MSRPLRVLHLYANYKWTGPADPAIRCAGWLRKNGVDAVFAQAAWTLPGAEHRMQKELARARMPVIGGLELRRHFQPFSILRDRRRLLRRLRAGEFDIVHTHQKGDHLIAALACPKVPGVTLVRSVYDPEAPRPRLREKLSFRRTAGVIVPTERCGRGIVEHYGLAADRVLHQEPPVDWHRFVTTPTQALRERLGLAPDNVAIGITARIQPHRRFELLWEVAKRVTEVHPEVRFLLLGRGNDKDTRELVREPVQQLGLSNHVVLPGYLYEPDYTLALRSLDVFMFLVPGSDGTCRAVREAMAAGLPVVSTQRGMLPDMLGEGGMAVAEDADSMSAALCRLVADQRLRQQVGQAATQRVQACMDPQSSAEQLLGFYQRLRGGSR